MKRFISALLACVMLMAVFPVIAFAEDSLIFTWAWDKNVVDVDGAATIVSWSGGTNKSYRSAFAVFDMPEGFSYNKDTTSVKATFTINSAKLNNGTNQAPTAAVVIVDGDSVKKAYALNNATGGSMLETAKDNGIFKGTYKINSTTPTGNALTFDITDYFDKHPNVQSVGIYLTNIKSDGFTCADGIASEMSNMSLDITVSNAYNILIAKDTAGNILERIVVKGNEGEEFKTADYLGRIYFSEGKAFEAVSDIPETFTVSENPENVTIVYTEEKGISYKATNSGYSGNAFGEGVFVATGEASHGTATRAKNVSGVSHSGGAVLGSARVGVMEFEIDSDINPADIGKASINFYVNDVHNNLGDGWIRLAFYETANPEITEYKLGGMDDTAYLQVNDDYSATATYWSDQKLYTDSVGWMSANVTGIIVNALDNYRKMGGTDEKIRVVIRMLVPFAAVNIDSAESGNAPYLNITTVEENVYAAYDFEKLTKEGRVEDISKNSYDALLLDDAKIENGQLYLTGNGAAQIDYEDFRDSLSSYTIVTTVETIGNAVTNTRIYDFGANSGNSGFLRVKEFSAGMKYNGGTTTLVSQNMGEIKPFEKGDTPYHIAVSYDGVKRITTVYVNGEKVIESSSIKRGLNEFADKTANNFIGRTNWYGTSQASSNPDIKATYDDFAVYNSALSERAVYSLYNGGFEESVEEAAVAVNEYLAPLGEGFITKGKEFFTSFEATDGNVVNVKWYSTDETVIDTFGNVFRGFEDEKAEVYAVVELGGYSIRTEAVTVSVKAYSEDELADITVLRYDFDSTGTSVMDETGKYNATAYTDSVQRDNRANISKDNIIKLPDDINKDVVDYTIAFNVRCDDLTRDGQRIYDFGMENGKANGNYYAFTKLNDDGSLTVGVNNGGSTQSFTSKKKLGEAEWYHVAISYSEATGKTTIYINGIKDSDSDAITYTMAGATYNNRSTSNYIGRSQWYLTQSSTNPDFVGKIDNFEFYNVCLSDDAVKTLSEQAYDGPDVEMTAAYSINGLDRAVIKIESIGYEGQADIYVANYDEGCDVKKETVFINKGVNTFSIDVAADEEIKIFLWEADGSLRPLSQNDVVVKSYEFNYDYETPDNTLLSNTFLLKAYDDDMYLSVADDMSLEAWSDDNDNLLWSSPYVYKVSTEGYYSLKNVDGASYVTVDGNNITTAEKSNWRYVQISPDKANGQENVFAILEKDTGKYLARSGNTLTAASDYDDESCWWVLDVVSFDAFSEMLVSPGFMLLSANERDRICGVTAQAFWQSVNRRNKLLEYMGDDYFEQGAVEQAERLRKIFDYVPSNQVNRTVSRNSTGTISTYTLGEFQANVEYRGTDNEPYIGYLSEVTYYTDDTKTVVEQTVKIYAPAENQIKQIAEGFSFYPYQFRRNIKSIRRYYHTANEFNCGADTMYVRGESAPDAWMFAMVSAHELGHSLDFSGGYRSTWNEAYAARSLDINKVSGYGNSNNYEDFAEFTQFVISCSGDVVMLKMVEEMFPGRFSILADILNDQNDGNGLLNVVYE